MTSRIFTVFTSLYFFLLMTGTADANPIAKIQELFKSGTDLFLTIIIPVLATCVLAWQALMVALGRKQFGDIVVVGCACAVAIAAGPLIAFFGS